ADKEAGPPGLLTTLKGHREAVYGISFTPDGKYLLTASGDPSIKIWNAASGKEVKTFAGPSAHRGLVMAVAVNPAGTLFATGGTATPAPIWASPPEGPLPNDAPATAGAVAVPPDGSRLAGGSRDGTVRLFNAADGKQLFERKSHAGAVSGLAFSPNGQVLVSC